MTRIEMVAIHGNDTPFSNTFLLAPAGAMAKIFGLDLYGIYAARRADVGITLYGTNKTYSDVEITVYLKDGVPTFRSSDNRVECLSQSILRHCFACLYNEAE